MTCDFDCAAPTVAVFGHPNHEIAVYGLLRRIQPHIVYLTDGGGQHRVAQTKDGLDRIGLAEDAVFLNYTEDSFYQALLDKDVSFFEEVSDKLKDVLMHIEFDQIICDAVELYNPVHDVTVPIVWKALADKPDATVFEIPLIYQVPGDEVEYALQSVPSSRKEDRAPVLLEPQELDAKMTARDEVYTLLADQLGPLLTEAPAENFRTENLIQSRLSLPTLYEGCALRYEDRGKILQDQGDVQDVITYSQHYVPVTEALLKERLHAA